jgi:hypothetical protein
VTFAATISSEFPVLSKALPTQNAFNCLMEDSQLKGPRERFDLGESSRAGAQCNFQKFATNLSGKSQASKLEQRRIPTPKKILSHSTHKVTKEEVIEVHKDSSGSGSDSSGDRMLQPGNNDQTAAEQVSLVTLVSEQVAAPPSVEMEPLSPADTVAVPALTQEAEVTLSLSRNARRRNSRSPIPSQVQTRHHAEASSSRQPLQPLVSNNSQLNFEGRASPR